MSHPDTMLTSLYTPAVTLFTTMVFAVGEVPVDESALKYAVTQGGLLAVVLVLLYFLRQNEKDRAQRSQDRIDTLMAIVDKSSDAHLANAVAVQANAAAAQANAAAVQRLASAVENFKR